MATRRHPYRGVSPVSPRSWLGDKSDMSPSCRPCRRAWDSYKIDACQDRDERMTERTNSAYRLNAILAQIPSIGDTVRVYDGWAQIFNIRKEDAAIQCRHIAQKLLWMAKELDLLEAQLIAGKYSPRLYVEPIRAARAATSPYYLPVQWAQIKGLIAPGVFIAFDHWSEMLPVDGLPVTDEQIRSLYDLVDELAGAINNHPALHPQLEAMIRHHIEMIRYALDKYPVAGGRVFKEAGYAGTGEMLANKDVIIANKDEVIVDVLGKVWGKVVEVADTASKFEKVARLGQHIHELLS